MNFDVFNGDADGICALIQLRLAQPLVSTLVTGVKRDIQLLNKIEVAAGDGITVLDISMQKNLQRVKQFLNAGATIFYVDHHQADEIPLHAALKTLINTDSNLCTSLLVNQYLQGKYPLWAVTAAFGDNITHAATQLATTLDLTNNDTKLLQELGIYINYNSYGDSVADLHFSPDGLYQRLIPYASPLDFIADNVDVFQQLQDGYHNDLSLAKALQPTFENHAVVLLMLPDEPWARRVQGVLGNALANSNPEKAHAVLRSIGTAAYQVSVRAPLNNTVNADVLCSAFPNGGGRRGAAGINRLPVEDLDLFIQKYTDIYS